MKYSNTVEYNINTKLDSSGLTKLQAQIKQLENSMQQMSNRELLNSDKVQAAKAQLEGLNAALTNSFNSSLGILDLSKFRAELDSSGVSASGLQSAFNMMGAEGQAALNGLTTQIANFNGGMERTSSAIDKVFTTFSNTFRWGLVSSFFSQFMNAIHSSVNYVKELDDSLTQIMLVTDYNRDSMNQFAKSANEAAKAVSMTTTGMTNASLIFAQQGYDLGQSQELATLSAKLANASQQDTATTSDQITAYMNAYGLEGSIEELTQQMDNWALIANVSAADVGELAQASQRAASMANAVGVSGEQLAAQIATIESVTREAPEQIGNGLKTLYARFSDIAAGGEDEDGFGLGKVTAELDRIGVQVLNEMGQIRDVGDIMEDLMVIWDDLDQTSKVAASQALAGKYQVNRFMALMDNSDMYQEYKGATGSAATGTLDQMNEEFANSIEGRSAKLQASLEGLFSTIFNTDDIYPWMDAAQGAVDLLQQFFDALGGGKTVLLGITSLLTQAFSQNIARSINDMVANRNLGKIREQNIATVGDTLDRAGIDRSQGIGKYIDDTANQAKLGALSDAQYDTYMNNVQQWANAQTALTQAEEDLTDTINVVNMAYGKTTGNKNAIFNDEGVLNTQLANEERANLSERQLNRLMQDTDFSDVAVKATEFSQSLQNVERVMKEVNADSENYDKQMNNLAQAIDLAGDKLAEFNALNVVSDDMVESILGDLTSLETKIRAGGEASEEAEKEIVELISMIGRLGKSAKDMNPQAFRQAMLGAGDLVDKKKSNVDFAQAQTNRAEENALDTQKNVDSQQQVKGILDTLNAVQQLTFAWQAFQNLGSIWANEDLSKGEKILQIIMNLTMAMPQLISAMESLKNTELFSVLGQGMTGIQQAFQSAVNKTDFGKGIIDAKEQLEELTAASEKGKVALEKIGQVSFDEITDELVETAIEGEIADAALAKIGPTLTASATAGTGALGVLKGGLAAVGAAAKAALIEFWPFLLIGGAIAAIGFAVGKAKEEAEKAKEEALEAFDEAKSALEQIQSLQDQIANFEEKFNIQKSEGKGFSGLIEDAEAIADSLKEAGAGIEANAIHLAILRAEALGTEEAYQSLIEEIQKQQEIAETNTDIDVMNKASEVLSTQGKTIEELIDKEQQLFALKERLKNLDEKDPNRSNIQKEIESLNEEIAKYKEAYDAKNQFMSASGDIAGNALAKTHGMNMHVFDAKDEATKRAGTEALTAGDMDWNSIDQYFEEHVKGYANITNEVERLAFAHEHLKGTALDASVSIRELLLANEKLSDRGGAYDSHHDYTTIGRNGIENLLKNSGFTNEESVQILATLDDKSDEEIKTRILELKEKVANGEDLKILLQADLDPEQIKEAVKDRLAAYEPTDDDVSKEDFGIMSEHFMGHADEFGKEGTPFEDLSSDISSNAEAMEELIEGILRYNDAVETTIDKADEWREALNSKDIEKQAIAVNELQETYADLLDLPADMEVSKEFAESAKNLELLEEAAEGTESAYDDLRDAAARDIIAHVEIEGGEEAIQKAHDAVEGLLDYVNSADFSGLNIGDAINLEGVDGKFNEVGNWINNLAETTGWSAQQMSDYLNSIGINIDPSQFDVIPSALSDAESQVASIGADMANDATISVEAEQVEQSNTVTDEKQYTDAYPTISPGGTWEASFPTFSGELASGAKVEMNRVTGTVPKITYTAVPKSAKEVKKETAQATGYKATQGGDGKASVQLKKGATASKGSTGGSKAGMGAPQSSGGGGGGGGSCFVAGTKISTYFGLKNIEDIQKNDIVLSYNEKTQQNEYSIVLQTMIHNVVEPIYTLYIKNEQLRVTGIHRFLVKRNNLEWIPAQDIKIGDWILFADGTWHLIWKIDINIEHQIVYNFEVSNNHNYYVGYNQILAHNKGGKGSCFVAGTLVTTDSSFKPIEQIQKDDIVLSYNEKLGMNEYSKVLQTMIHNTIEPIYTLHIKDEKLRVTGIHRFFVTNKIINGIPQWVHAANLKVGDWVLFADGTWHVIHKIDIDIEYQTVYNFEVSHNHNYYVGCNQILAHNKGGSGGSGGSAKTIKPKEKKEHEKDYYEEVDNQLKKTEKTLSKIEKENDRLTGDKARANYDKQIELLKKEVDLQEKKLKILTEQEKVDVEAGLKKADKELEDLLNQNGITWKIPDPVYDEDGIISNYEQISEAIDRAHNEMIDKYNAAAAAGNEELTKQIEEQISKIDKIGEDLLKKAKRANDIQTEIEDITATLEDLKDSIEDIRIEVYKTSQEALKDLKKLKEDEAEIDALFHDANPNSFIDRWTIDGTPFVELKKTLQEINSIYNVSADDARAYYDTLIAEKQKALETASEDEKKAIQSTIDFYTQQKGLLSDDDPALENGLLGMRQRNLEQLKKWMDNPSDPSNPFGDNIAALKDAYEEEYEASLEEAKHAQELGQEARDKYLDTMEDISDELDRHIDKYDVLLDQLENISDAYQLYYGEDNYDDILNIMNQQANVAEQKMQQLETAYNYWLNRYDEALKTGDETIIHDAEERLKDVQSAYADAAKEAAEYFVAIYEKTVESSIQKMTNKLWGGGPGQMDLEDQSTIWELQKDYMSNYKDDVEKSFEIDKLRSKYIGLLNDAQGMSLQTQNKIRAQMQDQLDLLQNQATVSEYDVKLANAKLEILQKQIALEDAQRNKNKMQLRRDTQGNYRYVYTADQGDIQKAQDELNESKYDAYEMTKEQTIANNDRAISLYNDYMEKIAAISKKYQDDEAAREAALAALSEEYRKLFEGLREDYADTTNGMYDLLTWMVESTTDNTANAAMNMLDTLYDKNGEVKENTGIAWRDLATDITENVLGKIDDAVLEVFIDINSSASNLATKVAGPNGPLKKIGATADTLKDSMNRATVATAQLSAATNELFGYLAADDSELAKATHQMAEYEEKLKGALSETSKLGEALKVANENLKAKTEEALNYKLQIDRLLSGEDIIENGKIVTAAELKKRKEEEEARRAQQSSSGGGWDPYGDAHAIWYGGAWGNGGEWYSSYAAANGTWKADQVLALFNSGYGYRYDTGGYTGTWDNTGFTDGKNGKLAFLHQKELVLNATDTENILGAVSIIRQLSNTLQSNLNNLATQSTNQNNISGIYNPSTTEQRVEIQATFPNATDADDIRTALLGLSDKAFQYAHRTI